MFVLLVFALSFAFGRAAQGVSVQSEPAHIIDFIEINGYIDPPTAGYIQRQIDAVNRRGSEALILRLDTLGFLSASVEEVAGSIFASKVPVVIWVAPARASARSGGFALMLAGDVAVAAPQSSLGPPLPLNLAGSNASGRRRSGADFIRSVAQRRGRPLGQMLDENQAAGPAEAAGSGLIDFVAGSPKTLLDTLQGRAIADAGGATRVLQTERAVVRFHKMSVWERILHSAIGPEAAYFLMLLGIFGLIFELYHPGLGAAGLLGGAALALSLYAMTVLPTSWAGVALIALSMLLYLRDLRANEFGASTVVGTGVLVAGSFLLFRGAAPELQLQVWAIAAAVPIALLFFVSVMTAAIRARLARPAPGSAERPPQLG